MTRKPKHRTPPRARAKPQSTKRHRRTTNGIPRAISAGRVPPEQRIPVESLRHYMADLSRAAGRGDTLQARREFARRCNSSVQYLVQLYLGIRRAQPAIALRIEQASYGLVRAEDLCRDFDWTYAKMRGGKSPRSTPPLEAEVAPSLAVTPQPEHSSAA